MSSTADMTVVPIVLYALNTWHPGKLTASSSPPAEDKMAEQYVLHCSYRLVRSASQQ
jgi:hypothetical protein